MKLKQEDLTKLLGLSVGYVAFAGLYSLFFNYLQNQLGITFRPAYFFFITFYFQLPLIAILISYFGYGFYKQVNKKNKHPNEKNGNPDTPNTQVQKTRHLLIDIVLWTCTIGICYCILSFVLFYYPKELHFHNTIGQVNRCTGYTLLCILLAVQIFVLAKIWSHLKKYKTWIFYLGIEAAAFIFLIQFQCYQYNGIRWDNSKETAIDRANNITNFSLENMEQLYRIKNRLDNTETAKKILVDSIAKLDSIIESASSDTEHTALKIWRDTIHTNKFKLVNTMTRQNNDSLQVNLQRVYKDSIMKGSINLAVLMYCLVLFLLLYNYLFGSKRMEKPETPDEKKINLNFNIIEFAIFGVFLLSVSIYRVPPKDDINTKSPFGNLNPVTNVSGAVTNSNNGTVDNHREGDDNSTTNTYTLSLHDTTLILKTDTITKNTTVTKTVTYNDVPLMKMITDLQTRVENLKNRKVIDTLGRKNYNDLVEILNSKPQSKLFPVKFNKINK